MRNYFSGFTKILSPWFLWDRDNYLFIILSVKLESQLTVVVRPPRGLGGQLSWTAADYCRPKTAQMLDVSRESLAELYCCWQQLSDCLISLNGSSDGKRRQYLCNSSFWRKYKSMTHRPVPQSSVTLLNHPADKTLKVVLTVNSFVKLSHPDLSNILVLIYACQVSSLKVYGVFNVRTFSISSNVDFPTSRVPGSS